MESILIDLTALVLLVLAAVRFYRRGLIATALSAVAFLLSLIAASAGYKLTGNWLAALSHLPASVGRILAYGLLLVLVQFGLLLVARVISRRVPKGFANTPGNLWGGAIVGVAQTLAVIGLSIYLMLGLLPVNDAQAVKASYTAKLLQPAGRILHDLVSASPAEDFQDTFRLLTVDPESHQSVPLGFSYQNGRSNAKEEGQVLDLINKERTSRGLKPLKVNDKAREVARAHSQDMLARGYFSHDTPEGIDPFERMRRGDVSFLAAGENLALAPDVETAHKALMNSPGHKANILDTKFKAVGIGVIDAGRYGLMVTQDFTN